MSSTEYAKVEAELSDVQQEILHIRPGRHPRSPELVALDRRRVELECQLLKMRREQGSKA